MAKIVLSSDVKPQSSKLLTLNMLVSNPIPAFRERQPGKMNEESSINPPAAPDGSDTDVVSLLKRMEQRLLLLERQIDLLISQSQEKPSGGNTSSDRPFRKRGFSKPFRSFDRPQRRGKGELGHSPRERDSAQGHFYEHRPGQKSGGPRPKNKKFTYKRKDGE